MSEQIYTIPLSEVFEECENHPEYGCPFCRLYNKLEETETDIMLGASLMEPDIRIKTNELGFCQTHYGKLLCGKNRLGLGLITESHLEELRRELSDGAFASLFGNTGKKAEKNLNRVSGSCYICARLDYKFSRMISNAVQFWSEDETFRGRTGKQAYICLPHLALWLTQGKEELKKGYGDFYKAVSGPTLAYFDKLKEDVSWFCKKFDYRYDAEPWGDSKDALERAQKFLCSDIHGEVKK